MLLLSGSGTQETQITTREIVKVMFVVYAAYPMRAVALHARSRVMIVRLVSFKKFICYLRH